MLSIGIFKLPVMLGRCASWMSNCLLSSANSASLALRCTQLGSQSTCINPTAMGGKSSSELYSMKTVKPQEIKKTVKPQEPKKTGTPPVPKKNCPIYPERFDICTPKTCRNIFPRFDALYYKKTNKLFKQYQQTWAEFPNLVKKKKVISCPDSVKPAKTIKKCKKEWPKVARSFSDAKCKFLPKKGKCPRIRVPATIRGRVPPCCKLFRRIDPCKRRKVPRPAFSESKLSRSLPPGPGECRCLKYKSMCDSWAYYRKLIRRVKVPNLHY